MSTPIPSLKRLLYFPGELLTADDLTTADGNSRALRWLHNSTLHNWGIAFGLDVIGRRGATSVTVNPGYANDRLGREIILSAPWQQPIPAIPGGANGAPAIYYLVANYVDDTDQSVEQQRQATPCGQSGAVRLSNDAAILWKTLAQLNWGIDIILAEVSIQNCVLSSDVSAAVRRYAYALAPSVVKAGWFEPVSASWVAWKPGAISLGFTLAIDTSHANFRSTPFYTAQIVGSRTLPGTGLIVSDFVSLANESPTGFTLQVALPNISESVNPASLIDPVTGPSTIAQLGWRVSWMGVEG
jgi:hypothetical protein